MTTLRPLIAAVLALLCVSGGAGQTAPKHSQRTKQPASDLQKQIVGKWENRTTGIQFLQGGGAVYYRERGAAIYREGLYTVGKGNRVRITSSAGSGLWTIRKLTKDALVLVTPAGREERLARAKPASPSSPAARCETTMRLILTAEEQYDLDHAFYRAVGLRESFVKAGLLGHEPRCPAGGRYAVVLDADGRPVVHCSVKAHDFGGRGLR